MTAFETQIYEAAKMLADKTKEELRANREDGMDWDALEQRFACLMIQARAQECRKLSGSLLLDPSSILRLGEDQREVAVILKAVKKLSQDLEERSHHLEQLSMRWATRWPPEDNPAPGKLVEIPDGGTIQ